MFFCFLTYDSWEYEYKTGSDLIMDLIQAFKVFTYFMLLLAIIKYYNSELDISILMNRICFLFYKNLFFWQTFDRLNGQIAIPNFESYSEFNSAHSAI